MAVWHRMTTFVLSPSFLLLVRSMSRVAPTPGGRRPQQGVSVRSCEDGATGGTGKGNVSGKEKEAEKGKRVTETDTENT